MSVIATAAVKITAETGDLNRHLSDGSRQLRAFGGSAQGAHVSVGRLERAFAGLAGQAAGTHPIVGTLAGVLGNFALGGVLTLGVIAGVAAIAVVYDKLTASARKAKEENDKMIASLQEAIHLKGLGPGGITVEQVEAANKRAAELKTEIARLENQIRPGTLDPGAGFKERIQKKIDNLYIERQNALNTAAGGQSIVNEKIAAAMPKVVADTLKLKSVVDEVAFSWKAAFEWAWRMDNTIEKITMREAVAVMGAGIVPDNVSMPNIDINDGLTKEQINSREKLIGNADKNAGKLETALWGSAQFVAQSVVSGLNVGGGGRGSQIGGAVGSGIGSVLGSMTPLGPIGGVIGGVIGGLAGSLFGGLFDHHKKAVNKNTDAIRALTSALILNAPQGFKIESYRYGASDTITGRRPPRPRGEGVVINVYNATDVRQLIRDARGYSNRGGVTLGTALAAA